MKRMWSKNEIIKLIEHGNLSPNFNAIDVKYGSIFRSDLAVEGKLAKLENIVDGQGNKRFIEGDIVLSTTTGLTQTYGKWSLSGTHLMIVIAGRFENGTAYAGGDMNEDMNIPEWILDKIIPVFSDRVIQETATFYADDFTNQTTSVSLKKDAVTGKLYIRCGSVTFTARRNFRFAFDLLIDNEAPEQENE